MKYFLNQPVFCRRLALFVLIALPTIAQAEKQFYVGASISDSSTNDQSRLDVDPRDLGHQTDDLGFKLVGGLKLLDPLAFEIGYVDFGQTTIDLPNFCPAVVGVPCRNSTAMLESTMVSLSAIGSISLRAVDLFGRVGVARWDANTEAPSLAAAENEQQKGTDAMYGIGAQLNLSTLALRFEYERFKVASDTPKLLSVGVTYRFR